MVNEHVFLLRANEKILQEYLFHYLFLSEWQQLLKSSITWQAQWWLNRANLLNIKVPLPSKEIQEKIVKEIGKLQEIEEENLQRIRELEKKIEEIVWSIESDNLLKLKDLLNITRGASPRPIREYQTNDVHWVNWIKIWDVKPWSKYITETKEKITIEWSKKSKKVSIWDFILSNSMSFWRPYIMKISWCIHDWWLLLDSFKKGLNIDYLYNILSSSLVQSQFKELASWWTTVDNLNIDKVENTKIPLPPLDDQKEIVSQIEELESEIQTFQHENKEIPRKKEETLRKYL
jgi:restriction endonuclease S subunit